MKKKLNKVVITGACGFIGSHLAESMIDTCNTLVLIDDLSRGKKTRINSLLKKSSSILFRKLDLRKETKRAYALFKDSDVVYNLAALNTGVDYDEGRTQEMFENNMLLQMIPLKISAESNVKKFIQVSSASIYSKEAMDERAPTLEEDDAGEPEVSKIGYALAKRMGEKLAMWYSHNTSLETVRVRLINVFGEHDHFDEKGHFIPVITNKILRARNTVIVFGSGNQKRSFLYVRDAVNALMFLSEKGRNGEVYNVDSNNEMSIAEIVSIICGILNKSSLSIHFDITKPEGSKRRLLNTTRIHQLGWKPKYNFRDALEATIEYVKKNRKSTS